LPLIAITLDAVLNYRAGGQTSEIPARDFFIGPMISSLPAGAVLTGVRFPVWGGKVGVGFHEVNARRSDFAFVSAAGQVALGPDGKCERIAIAVGAAHVAASAHPLKRTVRVAMFGAEELDFTNDAFTAAHLAEVPNIVAIGEIDEGADNVWRVELPKGAAELPEMKTLAASLAPLKVYVGAEPPRFGGSDVRGLVAAGAPAVEFNQDASRYFDWHHSSEDTLDKIDPAQMNQNVAAWAAFLTIVGESDVSLRPPPAPAPPVARP